MPKKFHAGLLIATIVSTSMIGLADAQTKRTREPVHRVAKAVESAATNDGLPERATAEPAGRNSDVPAQNASVVRPHAPTTPGHALDGAIEYAESGLVDIRRDLMDYTGILVKRERVDGQLTPTEFIKFKIRNAREVDGRQVPFSIYLRFLKPTETRGKEVIWVDGRNNGKLIAHDATGSALSRFTVRLKPTGSMAMKGNRYPIFDAGLENLVVKLIEKGTRDRAAGECIVNFHENASINKRACFMYEVIHPEPMEPYEFFKAKIYVDKELNLPVRYACWDWPTGNQKCGKLIEEYTYINLELNVGLTDEDFNHENPQYDYR